MIFRLTLKLSNKIGIAPLPVVPYNDDRNSLLDWNTHLFTVQRIQYIIMTNTASLYSMIMPGRGITNDKQFIREALSCMKEFMTIEGNKFIFEDFIEPERQKIFFSKIIDRRVSGSMNDLIFQAKVYLSEGNKLPLDVSFLLNNSPMSYLNYSNPRNEFQKLHLLDAELSDNRQIQNNVINISDYQPSKTKLK